MIVTRTDQSNNSKRRHFTARISLVWQKKKDHLNLIIALCASNLRLVYYRSTSTILGATTITEWPVFTNGKRMVRKGIKVNQWVSHGCCRLRCMSEEPLLTPVFLLQSISVLMMYVQAHRIHMTVWLELPCVFVYIVHQHPSSSCGDYHSPSHQTHLSISLHPPPITGLSERCCLDKLFSYGI